MRLVAALAAGAALSLGCGVAAAAKPDAAYFPNVPLVTQDGKTVRFYDDLLKGKQVAINVIFTDCTEVCPLETANLVQVTKILGDKVGRDIHFYSISIDPKRDTPKVLKAYAEKFGAKWLFLTGKPDDVKLVAQKLGLLSRREEQSHHAAQLMVGDEPNGQWTRNSAVDNPEFLAARMGTLLGWRDTAPQPTYADAKPMSVDEGKRLFQSRCSACHSLGKGDAVGPDLAGVSSRRERAWLARYIAEPEVMLKAGDPVAGSLFRKYKEVRMPNLKLGASEVDAIVSYLATPAVASAGKAQDQHSHKH